MATIAMGNILPPDVINIIEMYIIGMKQSDKNKSFKYIHQQLNSIFIHAKLWCNEYDYSNKNITNVLIMIRSKYFKMGRITDECRRGQCRCFPRRRNNYATMICS